MTKHTVSVHVKPTSGGEVARVTTVLEGKDEGGNWAKLDNRTQIAEGRNAVVDYQLEDGQRLIIESKTLQRVVVDPNQKAAILAPVEDEDGSQTIAANEAARLQNADQSQRRQAKSDDRIAKLMAESKGSPGPGELDKLREELVKEQAEEDKRLKRDEAKRSEEAAKSTTRPLTQAGGTAPQTFGKTEQKQEASAESKVGAKASGTPASMSGTSADGAVDSKQVKEREK